MPCSFFFASYITQEHINRHTIIISEACFDFIMISAATDFSTTRRCMETFNSIE